MSSATRIVRTEVTVERQAMAVLVGDVAAAGYDTCPLCGNQLTLTHAEHAMRGLSQGSNPQHPDPVDGPPPKLHGAEH